MLKLFIRPGCGFCTKVQMVATEYAIPLMVCNIENECYREELLIKGDRLEVPFLADEVNDIYLYGSELIVLYLKDHHITEK